MSTVGVPYVVHTVHVVAPPHPRSPVAAGSGAGTREPHVSRAGRGGDLSSPRRCFLSTDTAPLHPLLFFSGFVQVLEAVEASQAKGRGGAGGDAYRVGGSGPSITSKATGNAGEEEALKEVGGEEGGLWERT